VPWFEHGATLVPFLAWSLALPLTPITSWCDWQPQYGVAIAATALLLIGLATQLRNPCGKPEAQLRCHHFQRSACVHGNW
jgi:hypothetical protein